MVISQAHWVLTVGLYVQRLNANDSDCPQNNIVAGHTVL